MNLMELYKAGQKKQQEKHRSDAQAKLGCLRAGSTGCITSSGDVLGCPRKALLRKFSIDLPIDFSTMLMFEGGHANEDAWTSVMTAAGTEFKREEEIEISWTTKNGTRITGRPDMVLGKTIDGVFTPELGIELKEISSLWTIRSVVFDGQPKTANLMQAGHYMMQLDIPYKLAYASRNVFAVDGGGWMGKIFPKVGTAGSEFCEYNDKGNMKNIRPLMQVYDLGWTFDGRLTYAKEGSDVATPTHISKSGIVDYFEAVSTMETENNIGPRPSQVDALGEKASYSDCTYCDLKPFCDTYESAGLNQWLKVVNKTYGGSNGHRN